MSKTITCIDETMYDVYCTQVAYDKMGLYADLSSKEIGWLGYVSQIAGTKNYLIEDVFLVEQEVHATTTELDEDAISKHYLSLSEEEQAEFTNKCKCWGHSHVNMGVSPSGQDDEQGLALHKDVDDFYIRLIINKRRDVHITVYDKENNIQAVSQELIIYNPVLEALRAEIAAEIKEKVKEKTYVTTKTAYKAPTYSSGGNSYLDKYGYGTHSYGGKKKEEEIKVEKISVDNLFGKSYFFNSTISVF